MTTNIDSNTTPLPPQPPRPPLRRSQSDKVIAGVAGGVARWLGIDPVIVRVVLVVLAVFGGSGLVLYAIGWLFIPKEGSPTSAADDFFRDSRRPGSTARTVLIVIGIVVAVILGLNLLGWAFGNWGGFGSVLMLLIVGGLVLYLVNRQPTAALPPGAAPDDSNPRGETSADGTVAVADGPAPVVTPYAYGGSGQYPGYVAPTPAAVPPPPPRERSYLGLVMLSVAALVSGVLVSLQVTGVIDPAPVVIPAIALGILGLGILLGAWVGRARWLLWFAVPLIFVTAGASYVPVGGFQHAFGNGAGERTWTPTTIAEAQAPHELDLGSAELDLTELVIPAGVATVPVTASVGIGDLQVIVPEDARVVIDAEVQLGELDIDGIDAPDDPSPSFTGVLPDGPDLGPVIELTLTTDLGSLEVSRA